MSSDEDQATETVEPPKADPITFKSKVGKVHLCPTCQCEKGFGTCHACRMTSDLRRYQKFLRLKRDAATNRLQVVPESEAPNEPIRVLIRRPGRNEPCPCGNRRADGVTVMKYKHCCGSQKSQP